MQSAISVVYLDFAINHPGTCCDSGPASVESKENSARAKLFFFLATLTRFMTVFFFLSDLLAKNPKEQKQASFVQKGKERFAFKNVIRTVYKGAKSLEEEQNQTLSLTDV